MPPHRKSRTYPSPRRSRPSKVLKRRTYEGVTNERVYGMVDAAGMKWTTNYHKEIGDPYNTYLKLASSSGEEYGRISSYKSDGLGWLLDINIDNKYITDLNVRMKILMKILSFFDTGDVIDNQNIDELNVQMKILMKILSVFDTTPRVLSL